MSDKKLTFKEKLAIVYGKKPEKYYIERNKLLGIEVDKEFTLILTPEEATTIEAEKEAIFKRLKRLTGND